MAPEQKLTIQLSGLRFFGHYGLYPVESKWTTELTIDLSIEFNIPVMDSIQLKDTIDYMTIYHSIESEMNEYHQLLESIALNLIKSVKKLDERILHCKVRITKKPQLGGPSDNVALELGY